MVDAIAASRLFVFSGLPGTGKTTLARALAGQRHATYLRIDDIEHALGPAMIAPAAGYDVAFALAKSNLAIGNEVVVDAVNALRCTRQAWRDLAAGCEARLLEIEMVCSDVATHRTRLASRVRDVEGDAITWQQILDLRYDPWDRSHTVLDTKGKSAPESFADLLRALDDELHVR